MPRGFRLRQNALRPYFLPRRVHNSFPTDSFPLTFVPNESGVRMRTQPRHLAAGERKLPVPTIRCLSFMPWVVFSLSLCPPSLIGSKLHLFKISILAFVYARETIPRAEMVNLFVTPPHVASQGSSEVTPSTLSRPSSLHSRPPLMRSHLLQVRPCFLECPVSGIPGSMPASPGFSRSARLFLRRSVCRAGQGSAVVAGWRALRPMAVPSVSPFTCQWGGRSGPFPFWTITNRVPVNVCKHFFIRTFSFLLGKYLGVEWLGPMVCARLTSRHLQTISQRDRTILHSHHQRTQFDLLHISPSTWSGSSFRFLPFEQACSM